jgi:hypothetical protein
MVHANPQALRAFRNWEIHGRREAREVIGTHDDQWDR